MDIIPQACKKGKYFSHTSGVSGSPPREFSAIPAARLAKAGH
jgi:hypothetical protein